MAPIGTNYTARTKLRGAGYADGMLTDRSSALGRNSSPSAIWTDTGGFNNDRGHVQFQPANNHHAQLSAQGDSNGSRNQPQAAVQRGGSTSSQQQSSSDDHSAPDTIFHQGVNFNLPTPQQALRARSSDDHPSPDPIFHQGGNFNLPTPQQALRARSSSPGPQYPDTQAMLGPDTQSMVRQLTQHPLQCGFLLKEAQSPRGDVGKLSTSANLAESRIQQLRSDTEKIRRRSLSRTDSLDPPKSSIDATVLDQHTVHPDHVRTASTCSVSDHSDLAVECVDWIQPDLESSVEELRSQEEALQFENQELQQQAMKIEHEIDKAQQLVSAREREAAGLRKRADMMEEELERIVLRLKTQEERCRSKDAEAKARRAEVARLNELVEKAKGDLVRQSAERRAIQAS